MSEKVNYTAIGGFVMGALILALAGILVLGSGKFMKKTQNYILYFEGGMKGLSSGSTVAYRGVKIGTVVDVSIQVDTTNMSSQIPVIIEVAQNRFMVTRGGLGEDPELNIQRLIDKGLRAKLVTESYLTGKLMIEMGFYPDTEVRLLGLDPSYPEIPTIPSTIEELRKTLMNLPFEELFEKALAAVEAIDGVVSSPEIPRTVTSFRMAAEDLRKLANDLETRVSVLSEGAGETMGDYRQLARRLDEGVAAMVAELNETLESATRSFEQMESSLGSMEDMVSEDSRMSNEVQEMLREVAAAARSIRALGEYLERHPEALIQGKQETGR
jgi:paraquat-inducible protein B